MSCPGDTASREPGQYRGTFADKQGGGSGSRATAGDTSSRSKYMVK